MSELRITGLHKSFGSTTVLEDLELTVPPGSLTAILGPSGSGKTTLLRVLAGLQRPDSGTVTIGGRTVDADGHHVPAELRGIGYVPQEGALFPHLTVKANVAFGLPRAQRRGGARELLDMVGLTGLEKRYPHQLSGGQQQRVALARALAVKPEIVLLDEPFASLDPYLRASVREQVSRILRESSTTTLLVTHDQDEALSTADHVAVLRDGQIAQHATPQELYARPVDEQLARFIGEANLVSCVLDGELLDTPLGKLQAHWQDNPPPCGSAVMILIRPEQIELRQPTDGWNGHRGRVLSCSYHGHDALLQVQIGKDDNLQQLLVRTFTGTGLSPGSMVTLNVRGPVLSWPA